jgi:hypothetical protein
MNDQAMEVLIQIEDLCLFSVFAYLEQALSFLS